MYFLAFDQVGISIFKILLQIIRPRTVVLGNIPGTDIYRNLHHYKDAMSVPGFLILCIEAPINFANSMYLNERFACLLSETLCRRQEFVLSFCLVFWSVFSLLSFLLCIANIVLKGFEMDRRIRDGKRCENTFEHSLCDF